MYLLIMFSYDVYVFLFPGTTNKFDMLLGSLRVMYGSEEMVGK